MKPCKTADLYFVNVNVCVVVDRKILTDFCKTVETGMDPCMCQRCEGQLAGALNSGCNVFKLINYSCCQKPINDDHLSQVDDSGYLFKKHQQVFILDETCFHLRSNTCILMKQCNTSEK